MGNKNSTDQKPISTNYHTIEVSKNLPKVKKNYPCKKPEELPPANYWLKQMKSQELKKYKGVQHIMTNGSHTSLCNNHAILSAFLYAYNSHEDIVLSPDDIWVMICMYFSKYVNDNAEKLRSLFVDHEEKKKLTVVQVMPPGQIEPDWDYFLENMRIKISENVKNEVVAVLTPHFSTTTKIESFLSCATIMSTFKKYFDFDYSMTSCGIRNVQFMGTLEDWKVLRQKTEQLKSFVLPSNKYEGGFDTYIDGLLPILEQFIQTYQGNVDYQFWNTVMDIKHISGESGLQDGKHVTGWFLRLCYGYHDTSTCHIDDIQLNPISTDVNVHNELINETKTCSLVGGFHGVNSHDGCHKPVMSLAIIDQVA